MIDQGPVFKNLLKQLQQVPYLASKNLYRVAEYFLAADNLKIEKFCHALRDAKDSIIQCERCCTWKEKESACPFCDSPKRTQEVICVVETWHELMAIERTGGYTGLYHVLGGAICPLDGIGPEDLTIDIFLQRVQTNISEVILATNQTPEGEATAAYLAQHMKNMNVKISCLARGVPVGSSLGYLDKVTIYKALSERRPF